jgi:phage shock protein A
MNCDDAEREIFKLQKKAGLFLQAGDTEEYNRILTTIADLQKTTGATKGRGEEKDINDHRIA